MSAMLDKIDDLESELAATKAKLEEAEKELEDWKRLSDGQSKQYHQQRTKLEAAEAKFRAVEGLALELYTKCNDFICVSGIDERDRLHPWYQKRDAASEALKKWEARSEK